MDIQKEIRMTEISAPKFYAGTELGELYKAVVKRWRMQNMDAFNASIFYELGVIHGKRQERKKRKK